MKFGLNFFPSFRPEDSTTADYYAQCLRLAERADALGYSSIKTVEHSFFDYGGHSPNPCVFLSAIAARTKRIRLITGAVIPAFHHPAQLGGDLAMLDNMSRGRLDAGFGRAFLPKEFRAPGRRPSSARRGRRRSCWPARIRRPRRCSKRWQRGNLTDMELRWPASKTDIERIQRERKRIAVERALRSAFLRKRIPAVDLNRLDDIWQKIPLLTKEELRQIPPERFHDEFCIQPRTKVVEYWRSGGATGRPLFYPRSAEDMVHGLLAFERAWALIGATADDCAHISFPLGVHPVAHLYARAAINHGIGTIWCGAGTNTPSEVQLELIDHLKPTVWLGMASYGLHLANLAEAKGFDLRNSTVKKIIVAAEPLSPVKRKKLENAWGAEVFDHFGMTEAAFVAGEGVGHHGLHIWADLFYVEVVDEKSGEPVPEGEVGSLVLTPLWNNSMTPFLRWSSGDLVSFEWKKSAPDPQNEHPWSVFPLLRHARRTAGFFKVRGVNINHADLEDALFRVPEVVDFRAEVSAPQSGNDVLHLYVEMRIERSERVIEAIKKTFQVTPHVTLLPRGTIAREFEAAVKPPRFVDKRG